MLLASTLFQMVWLTCRRAGGDTSRIAPSLPVEARTFQMQQVSHLISVSQHHNTIFRECRKALLSASPVMTLHPS